MVFSGKYTRSPIASTNLVLKYTVFVNKFTLSTHDLDVNSLKVYMYFVLLMLSLKFCFLPWLLSL
uniref:Uncharacterized protein n=1 Tax=Aquila chrysaetos chrysaetos TaxID=223781 RepID=A0A663F251_AQUCH